MTLEQVGAKVFSEGVGAGIDAYFNYRGMIEERKSIRETNRMNIEFAEKETKRQDREFSRSHKLRKAQLAQSQAAQKTATVKSLMDNMSKLYSSNREQAMNIMNINRGRR